MIFLPSFTAVLSAVSYVNCVLALILAMPVKYTRSRKNIASREETPREGQHRWPSRRVSSKFRARVYFFRPTITTAKIRVYSQSISDRMVVNYRRRFHTILRRYDCDSVQWEYKRRQIHFEGPPRAAFTLTSHALYSSLPLPNI